MYYEFCTYNKSFSFEECKSEVFSAINHNIQNICITPSQYGFLSDVLSSDKIYLSTCIDYPSSNSTFQIKKNAVISYLRKNIQSIDLVITNEMFDDKEKMLKEIYEIDKICNSVNKTFSIISNIDVSLHSEFLELCKILQRFNIRHIYPSTGIIVEDYIDNVILCELIQNYTALNAVISSPLWNEEQFQTIKLSNIYGIRLYSKYNFVYI